MVVGPRSRRACIIVLSVILGLEVAVLMLLVCMYTAAKRPRLAVNSLDAVSAAAPGRRCRLRICNVQMMPLQSLWWKGRDKSALFADADVLLLQEAFRVPAHLHADPVTLLSQWAPVATTFAVAALPLDVFTCTDCGLAAAALAPWECTFASARPFRRAKYVDTYARKGVVVFEISGGLRLANVHMQASYTLAQTAADDNLRLLQFQEAVDYAVEAGAAVLAGDVNVDGATTLAAFDAIVEAGGGYRIPDDGDTTSPSVGSHMAAWRTGTDAGKRVDYIWVLDAQRVGHVGVAATDRAITDPWSDHAAVTVTLEIY